MNRLYPLTDASYSVGLCDALKESGVLFKDGKGHTNYHEKKNR